MGATPGYGNVIFEGVPGPINRVRAQNSDFAIFRHFLSQPAVVSTVRGNLRWHWVLDFVYSTFTWLLQLAFYWVLARPFCQASLVSYVMVWSPEAPCPLQSCENRPDHFQAGVIPENMMWIWMDACQCNVSCISKVIISFVLCGSVSCQNIFLHPPHHNQNRFKRTSGLYGARED